MDQAYMAVQSKASPIMKAPYRIGFEIVHRNNDNTRLVGIFVFRVNKDLYYAPVFFINGAIKGTDLFYRHTTKSFVPCTESWIEYLISLSETSEGRGVPISERINTRRQLNLQSIVQPPDAMMVRKHASADISDEDVKLCKQAWEELAAIMPVDLPTESILRKFIVQDGGFNALTKIANTCKNNFEFTQALFHSSRPENYCPEIEPYKAPEPPTPVLTLHQDILKNANVKSASATDLHKGYMFEDNRPKEATSDGVFEPVSKDLQSVTQPGIYQVLTADGGTREMICAYHHKLFPHDHLATAFGYNPICSEKTQTLPVVLIDTGDHKSKCVDLLPTLRSDHVMGKFEKDIDASTVGETTPSAGKLYRVYNAKAKSLSDHWYVKKVTDQDLGIKEVELVRCSNQAEPVIITLNPDYPDYDPISKVFGSCCKWVPVKMNETKHGDTTYYSADESLELGNLQALNEFIFQNGFAKAAVEKVKDQYLIRLHANEPNTSGVLMSKLAATAALMVHCAIKETDADTIIKAASTGRYLFYYEPAEKLAHNLRFPQFPEFYDNMNSDYNVQEQPQPSRIMVMADKDVPYIEKHRIGDKVTFDNSADIDTKTPMDLYNLSQSRGVGSLFEHGIVGSLTNTFDSAALIDTYMPDLQQALDRIGRILFLFYWKPEDFAQSFGSDDQSQLENKLVSNFKSFGDLVLELLQKTRSRQEGTVSLA